MDSASNFLFFNTREGHPLIQAHKIISDRLVVMVAPHQNEPIEAMNFSS